MIEVPKQALIGDGKKAETKSKGIVGTVRTSHFRGFQTRVVWYCSIQRAA